MTDIYVYTSKGYVPVEQDDYEEPIPEYDCGQCGVRFNYPDENGRGQDCCPDCGSINITEVVYDEPEFDVYYDSQGNEHAEF